MQDVTTLSVPGARAVTTDVNRKEPTAISVEPVKLPGSAKTGQTTGNNMPVTSDSAATTQQKRMAAESRQSVDQAIVRLNDYVQSIQRDLEFSVDVGSGAAVVRVVDRTTGEVVRQMPSDVALSLARNLKVQQQYQQQYAAEARPASDEAGLLGLINTRI